MFRNVLVAVDGSKHSDVALTQAIDLAECEHSRLTLMTGVSPVPAVAFAASTMGLPAAVLGAQVEAESILCQAREKVPQDLPVTTILTSEPIRLALIHQIKEGNHDLVVMGSRGRGAVRSALLGSVSHYVLHHSPVPVLIVHAEEAAEADSAPRAAMSYA